MKLTSVALSLVVAALRAAAADSTPGDPTVAAASSVSNHMAEASAAGPKIQFDSVNFDFGRVMSGEVVKHDFIFTNAGTALLEVVEVKPGCGCTTAGNWDKRVEPGKTGIIPLQFNSTAFSGTVAKSATITCNDATHTNMFLTLRGTVWKPIELVPTVAVFNISSEAQTEESRVLRITNNLGAPITLSDLQCTNAAFRAELKTLQEGWDFELRITAVPPFTKAVFSVITLKTSAAEVPVISATAFAVVQPVLVVAPQQIVVPAAPLSNSFTAVVNVRNSGSNTVSFSDARVNVPGVEVSSEETQPGRAFTLTVLFPPQFQLQPGQKAELSVRTSHPGFPVLTVPISQSGVVATAVPKHVVPGPVTATQRLVPLRPPHPDAASVVPPGN